MWEHFENSKALWKSKVLLSLSFLFSTTPITETERWKIPSLAFHPFKLGILWTGLTIRLDGIKPFLTCSGAGSLVFLFGSYLYCNALSVPFVHLLLMGRKQVIFGLGICRQKMCPSCYSEMETLKTWNLRCFKVLWDLRWRIWKKTNISPNKSPWIWKYLCAMNNLSNLST